MELIIAVIVIFTGLNLFLWKRRPHDGEIIITTDRNGKKIFSLELDKTPDEIEKMTRVSFKVVSTGSSNDIMQLAQDEVAD